MAEGAPASKDGAFHTLRTSLSGAAEWIDELELIWAKREIEEATPLVGGLQTGGQRLMLTAVQH